MTISLETLVKGMLIDVKKGKFKKKLVDTKIDQHQEGLAPAVNPWTDEALVLIMTVHKCSGCGNESTSWNKDLYIERHNKRRRLPIVQIERINNCVYSSVYGGLPKRIEVIEETSMTCPMCFGLGDTNHNVIQDEINPHQLELLPCY